MSNAPANTPSTSPIQSIWNSPYGDETVWKMSDVYRKMIDSENLLAANRRNWYIGFNTFLGGILSLVWSNHCPCYLGSSMMPSTVLLSVLGIIVSIISYRNGNTKYRAIRSILHRWDNFLKSCCSLDKNGKLDVNNDYTFPPIIGLFEESNCLCEKHPVASAFGLVWLIIFGLGLVGLMS